MCVFLTSVSHSWFCASVHYIIRFQKLIIGSSLFHYIQLHDSHCSCKKYQMACFTSIPPSKSIYSLSGFGLKIPPPPPQPVYVFHSSLLIFQSFASHFSKLLYFFPSSKSLVNFEKPTKLISTVNTFFKGNGQFSALKVVGNEKGRDSGSRQLLE